MLVEVVFGRLPKASPLQPAKAEQGTYASSRMDMMFAEMSPPFRTVMLVGSKEVWGHHLMSTK